MGRAVFGFKIVVNVLLNRAEIRFNRINLADGLFVGFVPQQHFQISAAVVNFGGARLGFFVRNAARRGGGVTGSGIVRGAIGHRADSILTATAL